MNKKALLYILLDLVFVVVFNVLFFVIGGTDHTASVWVSYGFIHLAYIMVVATPFLGGKSGKNAVLGLPLYYVSSAYFFAELVVGLAFILIARNFLKAALVSQVILAGIYAVLLLINLIANENTAESLERQEAEVAFIKESSARVKLLVGMASGAEANKEIEKVYDLIHSAPTRSHRSVEILEADIKNLISALEAAVANDNVEEISQLCQKLTLACEERNKRIKSLKE